MNVADPVSGAPIPVTLVTGALGSGKTSLLNKLLAGPMPEGTAVIVNEFGTVAVDNRLVIGIDGPLVVLSGGCLCCAVRGALIETLRDLFLKALRREIPPIRHLLIETTGLARVAPLRHSLTADFFVAARYRLQSVLTVIDACHLPAQCARLPEVQDQVIQADALVLGKTDLADPARQAEARAAARALNPIAPIHEADSLPPPELLLQSPERAGMRIFPVPRAHDPAVRSMSLFATDPIPWGRFARALDALLDAEGGRILRIKGWLAVEGVAGQRIVHAVHHQRYPALDLPKQEETGSRLVVIWQELPAARLVDALSEWFAPMEDAA
ncbi:MAG: CobW family GTP-binding protein [Halothiobacillaceae bacterium]